MQYKNEFSLAACTNKQRELLKKLYEEREEIKLDFSTLSRVEASLLIKGLLTEKKLFSPEVKA